MHCREIRKFFTALLSVILIITFSFQSVFAATKTAYSEFYVVASDNENLLPHWLHIVVYDEQWYITPKDACEYGGFKNYSLSGEKVYFSRPYFIVGQLDPTDTRIGSDFYMYTDPFVVTYSGETITYKGSLYVNFNSVMNTLRTIASYDSTRGVFVFEPSAVFPAEIDGLCTCLMQNDRYNIETRGPLATRLSYNLSTFWNTITGGETDEEAVFRAILSDPTYKDPKLTKYLKTLDKAQEKFDYANSYVTLGKAYINDEIDHYTIIDTWVTKKLEETYSIYAPSKPEYKDMYPCYGSTISLEGFHMIYDEPEDNGSQSSGRVYKKAKSLAWKAYKDYQQVKSWNSAYMAGIKWAFSDDDIYGTVPSRVVSTAHKVTEQYDARDYKLNTPILKDLIKKEAKEDIINGAKEYLLGKWNVCLLKKLDDLFGYSQTISESNQIVISRKIQEQCYHKNSSLRTESDPVSVMGQKYITILFLKAYIHACSLLENKSTLTKIAGLLDGGWSDYDEKQDTYSQYYSSEIDRVAPILAFLIRIDDNRYLSMYDNKIGNSGTSGVLEVDLGNMCDLIRFQLYNRDNTDLSKINSELKVGSVFFFGEYEQDNNLNNGPEPIEWIVQEKDTNGVKASSVRILDSREFKGRMWFNSDLRRWCNHEFIESAFADYEVQRLEYMQYRGGRNNESQSANMDYSSVDRVLLYNTGATIATPYAIRNNSFENRYWLSREYHSGASDDYGHQFVKEDGTVGYGYYYQGVQSRSYGIKPYITVSFDSKNDAKRNLYLKAVPGDLITLGKDELDGITSNGYENIDWMVMARTDDYLFIETHYPVNGIDDKNVSDWKTSSLREWLNGDFYNAHINENEKKYIVKTNLRSASGYATSDYLFPQSEFAKYLMYSNYSMMLGSISSQCSLETVKNPITVCAVISLNGTVPEKLQVEGMYSNELTNLSDKALKYKVGDSIFFGSYEQDLNETNGRESIEWIILGFNGTKALVISKYALNYRSITSTGFGLSTTALREWLNDTFRNSSFTEEDQKYISGDLLFMDYSLLKKYLPEGNPNRTALITHYAYNIALDNTRYSFYSDIKKGDKSFDKYLNPKEVYGSIGTLTGEYWAFGTGISGRVSPTGEWVEDKVNSNYYIRPAMWISISDSVDVSNEQEFIAALTGDKERTYKINIVDDLSLKEDYSELNIVHGDIQFNGHTLTFEQKGNDDYLYFGGDDSVAINLEGGDEPGSAIKVDSSFMGFLLRNPSSTINSVKIYIGDNEQKPGFVNVVNEKQFITALTDSSNREYTVNIVSDFVLATDLSNTKINHGNVNFNGHTLKITSKGNGDYYYFGGSDSVIINLDGGENGSVIRLDSSYSHFALRNKKSTFKNIKIYIGNNQQTAPAPTDTYEVYDCYPLEIVFDENKLVVTNKSDVTINDWAFRLTFEDKINSLQIYSGQPFEISEDKYSVVIRSRTEWHQVIAPGESLEVSLNLNDFHTKKPSRIELVETDPIVTNDLHKITVSDTQNGYVVLSKYSAKTGEKITVTAIPDEGYVIGSISINGSAITGTTFTLGDSDATVDVIFTNAQFKVTVNKPANGSVSIDKETAHFGETITVTATPEACYELEFIKVNGEPIEGNTFTMPEKDVTIVVAFKAKPHELTCIPAKSATCTEDGYEAYYKCSGCGKLFSDAEGKNEITEPKVIKALGHSWDEGTTTKEPTCEETGSKLFKCTREGCTESKTEELAALGHHLVLIKEKAPTKTEPGNISYYKCDREGCGKLFSDAEGKHEISLSDTVIPVMIHELILIKAKDATCTESGNTAYYVCKDTDCGCGKVYSDKYGQHEIKLEDTVIPAKGHSIIAVDEKKATCTEDGHASHFECSTCHKKFSDSEGKTEINAPEVYPKLGHSWDEGEVTTQPGCETEGVKTFHCTREGCKSTKEEPVLALGHDKEHLKHVKAKAETYDEDGNIEYYICERCGKKFADPDCKSVLSDAEIVIPKKGAPELGDLVEIGNFKYQVTNPSTDGTGTLTFKGVITRVASVSVPATVTIKESSYIVNRIGTKAFYGDKTLKTVYIGNNVVIIDSYAFYGCSNLVKVSGGKALKTIGTKAFAYCSKLKSFSIASSVLNKIGSYAFQKDKKLKTIYIRYTTKLTKSGVKKSLKKSYVKTVKVKKSKVKKYKKYFKKSNSGRSVKVKK